MSFHPRSLNELGALVRGAFRQYLPGTDATLKQNFLAVTAKVLALLSREYELRLEWVYKQLFTRTTTDMAILRMQGADFQLYQKGAAPAVGGIETSGPPNVTYPAGIRYLSGGVSYVTTAPFTTSGSGEGTPHIASERLGAITNREPGSILNLADPSLFAGLSQEAAVDDAGLGGGADMESVESLKARILDRKARPPQGGALPDYERFAMEVPGVLKAWAFSFTGGVGSIAVYFLFQGRPNLIPTAGDVAAVQAHIGAKRLIRVDDEVAIAPLAAPVDVTISGLSRDTPAIRASIEANLRKMLFERARPGPDAEPFVLSRSWIGEAVSTATGEDRHTLVSPAGDLTFTGGSIPVLGSVTYA